MADGIFIHMTQNRKVSSMDGYSWDITPKLRMDLSKQRVDLIYASLSFVRLFFMDLIHPKITSRSQRFLQFELAGR